MKSNFNGGMGDKFSAISVSCQLQIEKHFYLIPEMPVCVIWWIRRIFDDTCEINCRALLCNWIKHKMRWDRDTAENGTCHKVDHEKIQ